MILEQFIKWQEHDGDEKVQFKRFAQGSIENSSIEEVLHQLMYQIYNTQCCIEGLLEDMEIMNKEIISLKKCKKGKKKCA